MSVGVPGGPPGVPGGPVGHFYDKNEALGPRNPFIKAPRPSFDEKILKNTKNQCKKSQRGVCKGCVRGVQGNSSIGNSLGTT